MDALKVQLDVIEEGIDHNLDRVEGWASIPPLMIGLNEAQPHEAHRTKLASICLEDVEIACEPLHGIWEQSKQVATILRDEYMGSKKGEFDQRIRDIFGKALDNCMECDMRDIYRIWWLSFGDLGLTTDQMELLEIISVRL